jgi:TP901 family phage tail tape measure protein
MSQIDFTLSLIKKITGPLKQAKDAMKNFADASTQAFERINAGVGNLSDTGSALQGALAPAIQMFNAMQEASSRGISSDALDRITKQAMDFSMQYGTAADEYVKSSAAIHASIGGLADGELTRITHIANTVAKAVGATAEESSAFYGLMFNEFRTTADEMGRVQFAEQLAGQMAWLSNTFNTGMAEIQSLMAGTHGAGAHYGVALNEQLAVLGELNKTLGSEASSAYASFLSNAVSGAEKLGLSFTDTNGKLLAMPDILQKLQGKYGASINGNLTAQAELDAAFGDSAVVIKQLYGNVGTLQRYITDLGRNDGLNRVQEMAANMTSPWERLIAVWNVIRAAVGLTLLPVLYPLLDTIADGGQQFAIWMEMFPNIARVVGYAVLAVLSFSTAGAAANVVIGVSQLMMIGINALWKGLTAVTKIYTAALWVARTAVVAWNAVLTVLRGVLLAVRIAAVLAGVSINFMSWPILLIIGAIALLAAGCYLLITHWDEVKAAVMNTAAFQVLVSYINYVAGVFSAIWNGIAAGWNWVCEQFEGVSPLEGLANVGAGIGNVFGNLWNWLKGAFSETYSWIVDKLNMLPGINIKASAISDGGSSKPTITPEALLGGKVRGIGRGGLAGDISNSRSAVTDNSRTIGSVTINTGDGMTPGRLMEWQELMV